MYKINNPFHLVFSTTYYASPSEAVTLLLFMDRISISVHIHCSPLTQVIKRNIPPIIIICCQAAAPHAAGCFCICHLTQQKHHS